MPVAPELYLAFVAATALLIVIPGPAVSLIVANGIAYGGRRALISVAGTSSAIAVQLAVVAFGMASAMAALAEWFGWLRWAGVVYLVYLGVRAWRAPAVTLDPEAGRGASARRLYWQGFVVNGTNPKMLFFLAAFFPQFVDASLPLAPQMAVLSASFLAIAMVLDGSYALLSGRLRRVLAGASRLRNRLTGTLLIGAGLGLALARRG